MCVGWRRNDESPPDWRGGAEPGAGSTRDDVICGDRLASIRWRANGSAPSRYRIDDFTSFQPTYSIKVLMSQPFASAHAAKPRRCECPLYSPGDGRQAWETGRASWREREC